MLVSATTHFIQCHVSNSDNKLCVFVFDSNANCGPFLDISYPNVVASYKVLYSPQNIYLDIEKIPHNKVLKSQQS